MNVKKTIKKWAGRGIAVVLGAMLLGSSIPAVTSQAGTENVKTTCTTYSGDNVEDQTYSKWASTIKSYLTYNSDGSFMRVQAGAVSDGYLVEYYDSNYNLTGTKIVAEELSIFGGFYEMGDYYYILTGQKNSEESDDVEVYRITKYDKNWTRIKSCGLYGANTYIPFEAGSARMTEYGDYLMIRTCHEMYVSSDGYHHQANVTIQVDTTSMEVVDSYYSIMNSSYGYVSHSFNQFIQMENGKIVSVDHGDAHPRSIVLIKYPSAVTSNGFTKYGCKTTDLITFEGETGVNYTGASVGGFEISDTAYLVAGSQDIDTTLSSTYTKGRNIFVAVESKSTGTVSVNYITDYELGTGTTDTPQFVKIANNSYLLLWHRGDSIYYTKIDGNGNQVGSIYSMEGDLSDCVPVVAGNRLVWYTWKNETIKFYEISLTDISSNDVTTIVNGHKFTYSDVDEDDYTVTKTCTECGYSEKFYVVKSFTMYWKKDESSSSYYPSYNSRYDVGATVKYWVYSKSINTATDDISANEEMTVIVEDDSIISLSNTTSSQGTLTMLKPGITTVTIYPTYNPSAAKSYVFRVGEEGSLDINDCEVKLSQDTYEYTGSEFKPTAVVTYNGTTLTSGTDYTLSYADNKNAGEATVTITGAGLFAGTKDVNFTIEPLDISAYTLSTDSGTYTYDGTAKTPDVRVIISQTSSVSYLLDDSNYSVSYEDNVQAGTGKVIVEGTGNYDGRLVGEFEIGTADISEFDVSLDTLSYTYDGTVHEPEVTVTKGSVTIPESNYEVVYKDNVNAGTGSVTITGKNSCTGSVEKEFSISKASIENYTLELENASYIYDGTEKKPSVVVKNNGKVVTNDSNSQIYEVSYTDNVDAGKGAVTVTGTGNYEGSLSESFDIAQADISEGTVSLKEKELVYNGSSQVPELTVNIGDVLLVSEKDYTVVLPDAVNTGDYTVTVTGKGNYKGSIDTAYSIIQKDIADADATLEADKYIYDGTEKEPAVNIVVSGTELKENSDYTVEYENNIEIGEATVIVTGQGNYTGSKKVQFIIKSDTSDKDGNNTTEGNDNNTSEDNGNVTPGDKDNNTSEGSGNVIPGDKDNNASEGNENVIPGDNDNNITDEAGSNKTDGDPDTSGNSISVAKTSITSIANTSSGIKLTWKKISGATGYIVYRKTASSSKWTKVKTITKAATVSYTDKAVKSKNGQKYVYKIETYKVTDSSSISSTSNQKNIVRLTAPAKLKAVNISSKKMKLTWAKNKKVTGYQIQYSTSKTFAKGNKTVKVSKATLKKTISKLKKGKTYYVRIRAYCKDSSGISYSAWSSKKTVKIKK
jgi:predicted nucleic-acid-binding Zn-ribbon protein